MLPAGGGGGGGGGGVGGQEASRGREAPVGGAGPPLSPWSGNCASDAGSAGLAILGTGQGGRCLQGPGGGNEEAE